MCQLCLFVKVNGLHAQIKNDKMQHEETISSIQVEIANAIFKEETLCGEVCYYFIFQLALIILLEDIERFIKLEKRYKTENCNAAKGRSFCHLTLVNRNLMVA